MSYTGFSSLDTVPWNSVRIPPPTFERNTLGQLENSQWRVGKVGNANEYVRQVRGALRRAQRGRRARYTTSTVAAITGRPVWSNVRGVQARSVVASRPTLTSTIIGIIPISTVTRCWWRGVGVAVDYPQPPTNPRRFSSNRRTSISRNWTRRLPTARTYTCRSQPVCSIRHPASICLPCNRATAP